MSEDSDNPEPLPAEKLCNSWGKGNPILGDGALGNEKTGHMYYAGSNRKKLVETVQKMLKTLDYDLGTSGPDKDGIDGVFGELTENAVKDFQKKNKDWDGKQLKDDGLVGPETSDALNRAMVGIWYDIYETPKELTKDELQVTVTKDALMKGMFLDIKDVWKAKVAIANLDKHIVSLLDSSGNRFFFEGEGSFIVLDKKEKPLVKGKMMSGNDITFESVNVPVKVELNVGEDVFTFLLEGVDEDTTA